MNFAFKENIIVKSNLRYGIRKHKLGAASVFLGTMIVVEWDKKKKPQHRNKKQYYSRGKVGVQLLKVKQAKHKQLQITLIQ